MHLKNSIIRKLKDSQFFLPSSIPLIPLAANCIPNPLYNPRIPQRLLELLLLRVDFCGKKPP